MSAADLPGQVHVSADADATALAAGEWLSNRGADAVATKGEFHVALAGGSTPARLYALLGAPPIRDEVEWERWWLWFGDERAVPPADEASNSGLVERTLLRALAPDQPAATFRMEAERPDIAGAAAAYSRLLDSHLMIGPGGAPRLDVVLLGLGENGHTASLFPGDPSLDVTDRWAVHSRADYAPFDRITLTYPALNAASRVAFLVTGAAKAQAFAGVLAGTAPAARVRPADGELHWFLDQAAAESVPDPSV